MLIPTSAPRPSSPPSLKRVEALTTTAEEQTSRVKRAAAVRERVMIASVCSLP